MRIGRYPVPAALLTAVLAAGVLVGCGTAPAQPQWLPAPGAAGGRPATADPTGPSATADAAGSSPTPSASPSPTPSPTPTVPPDSAIPGSASGSFAAADGAAGRIGIGARIVTYRVEVEQGIDWGGLEPWTVRRFADRVDGILAASRGWTESGFHPVTDRSVGLNRASWSFRRVGGNSYDVRIRLATPQTVDRLCGQVGLTTAGVFSCRFGTTIMINLRRWLQGADGYPVTIDEYQTSVINHEIGHYLGFDHMGCAGQGRLAPVMGLQTTDLGGCRPNPYPFDEDGRFVSGPWQPS
ncbi:DUF3152 domain-containing protein [Solwaraspora sp. WMMD792]|uniref:DUF3152 domain-containing protein n=1 Tax=Solwaraspora sp. WMMD792 TaxID=3016099 RepID=UPI002416734B|nr:DUF3152 domain-containing protein [Solwaraspora sp. WMMD792]MDG4775172.1 DUF3152 domain-containing protein [Solwaraspora sp. WMMD792]